MISIVYFEINLARIYIVKLNHIRNHGKQCKPGGVGRGPPCFQVPALDSGSQKLQRFGKNRGFSHLCRGSTIEVKTKNSTDLRSMPGIELKSVEFFVFTSICQQLSPLLSVKRLKRLMHLLGSGVTGYARRVHHLPRATQNGKSAGDCDQRK